MATTRSSSCVTRSFIRTADLLLHDMGTDLADNGAGRLPGFGQRVAQHAAAVGHRPARRRRSWLAERRRPEQPVAERMGTCSYLHDGRAEHLIDAVLWHGGEAKSARDAVVAMPSADRDALVAFLKSL